MWFAGTPEKGDLGYGCVWFGDDMNSNELNHGSERLLMMRASAFVLINIDDKRLLYERAGKHNF